MSRRTRIARAAALAALALAITVTPALAAGRPATAPPAAATTAEDAAGRTRCAAAWRTALATPSVETWKAVGRCEVDRRLATIERLRGAVDRARALTDAHESALEEILDGADRGLRALRAEIEADTTIAELRVDIRAIFEDFRIYALVARQVWLVGAADATEAAAGALDGTADDLAVLIDRAAGAGDDVTDAAAHLAAMRSAIEEARAAVGGVAGEVLPLTPAGWNDGTAGPILRAARASLVDARANLRTALAEARQVIAALAG